MTPAILTAFFFAWSAIFSQRATRIFGSIPAHFFRLCGACLILGLLVSVPQAMAIPREVLHLYLLSGVLGFGMGDAFLFAAYPRLGSRITLLIQFCGSALTGALGDWIWLGRVLSTENTGAVLLVLGGLAITLQGKGSNPVQRSGSFKVGILLAACSAICMGLGTVMSNQAITHGQALSVTVPPMAQAWLRVSAGMAMACLLWLGQKSFFPPTEADAPLHKTRMPMRVFWLGGTMVMGPVIGVSCYQWALVEIGKSAIVLAMAATSAIFILPMARFLEKDKPKAVEIVGTVLAVAGIVWLRFQG